MQSRPWLGAPRLGCPSRRRVLLRAGPTPASRRQPVILYVMPIDAGLATTLRAAAQQGAGRRRQTRGLPEEEEEASWDGWAGGGGIMGWMGRRRGAHQLAVAGGAWSSYISRHQADPHDHDVILTPLSVSLHLYST
ncbi:hypothetical protein DFH27DRAFT_528588 [Peziza echinospora]|nr:hypothetical protein DFH27DRAFT_528588 [Peziza echinospora]